MTGGEETVQQRPELSIEQQITKALGIMEATNEAEIGQKAGKRIWQKKDFDIYNAVKGKDSLFIEIAGPTPQGYSLIDVTNLDRKILTSNLAPVLSFFPSERFPVNPYPNAKVDFVANGERMPLQDQSASVVFLSNCPGNPLIYKEVFRILRDDGLFVIEGFRENDLIELYHLGFTILNQFSAHIHYPSGDSNRRTIRMEGVFQKGNNKDQTNIEDIAKQSQLFRPVIQIYQLDMNDRHPLNTEEQVEAVRERYERKQQLIKIPTYDSSGRKLTAKEQLNYISQNYPLQ